MLKIHILGGPGSGKTTLAEQISARFHIPPHDLDLLDWSGDEGLVANIDYAFALAQQPGWVAENIGLIWLEPLLYEADCIVLLEVSWYVAAWRILRRHIEKSLRGVNRYPTKLLLPFIIDAYHYYVNQMDTRTKAAMQVYFEEHGNVVELPDAKWLLRHFEATAPAIPLTAEFTRRYAKRYKEKLFVVRNKSDRERLFELLTKMEQVKQG